MRKLFVSQPPFSFQIWPNLEWNQDFADHPGKLFHPLIRSCFLLFRLEKLSLLALSLIIGTPFLHCEVYSFLYMLYRQGAALAHLDYLPPHDLVLWTDGSVPFPFGKGGSGVFANCYLCGTEATISFLAGAVCTSFSAEACAILHAFCWSRQHQQVCHFSYYLILVLSSPLYPLLHLLFLSQSLRVMTDSSACWPSGNVFLRIAESVTHRLKLTWDQSETSKTRYGWSTFPT